jgi:hypothetical protein
MADPKQAWKDVGERFESLGKRVAAHYREAGTGDDATQKEAQRKLEEAAREVGDQLTRAFNALGETLRDDEAKRDLKEAVHAIGEAVASTVSEAGDAIGRAVRPGEDPPPPGPPDAGGEPPAN